MPVYQHLINFDNMLQKLSEQPIILNDLVNDTEEGREEIRKRTMSRYSSDLVSLLPSCLCGKTTVQHSKSTTCEHCGTVVKSSVEDDIEPSIWFRKPNGVEKIISPIVWIMLKQRFSKSGFNVIQWLCDTNYRPIVKQPVVMDKIVSSGIQRGYNNFVQNFDVIINFLFSLKDFKVKKGKEDYLRAFIDKYRDSIFSDYIPLPNKSLIIIEKTNVGVYIDPIIVGAMDAIEMLTAIDTTFYEQNPKSKANRMIRALSKLCSYYELFYKNNLAVKSGQFRKHIYGSRVNYSFRAVISSLTGPHEYDEIHVPWGIGLTAFRQHLINKLLKLGMDLNSAIGLLLGHVNKYHPLLDNLLKELILESKYKGIVVSLQRN